MYCREKTLTTLIRLALTALASTVVAQTTIAQETPSDKTQKVEITGSNLKRIDLEGATGVEIIKREDIDRLGATTVVELLSKLPSVQVSLDGNSQNTWAVGSASVALRGLDSKYTLILLNGRRIANYGFANGAENTFVDLNALPLGAIESIEILRDGASAIYGSDAVAGVINFKTRKNYQGLEGAANLGMNQQGDGGSGNVTLTGGWGDLEQDRHNLLVSVDLLKRSSLWSDKHSATSNADYSRFGGTDNRATGLFLGSVRDFTTANPGWAIPGCRGSVEVSKSTGDTVCLTNPRGMLTPDIERGGVSAIFTQRLNAQDEVFVELGLNHSRASYWAGYPGFDSAFKGKTAGSTNPGLATLPQASNVAGGFTPGDVLQITRAIYEAGQRVDTVTNDTERLVTGWRGTIGKWDSELSLNLNQNRVTESISNQVLKDVSTASLQSGLLGTGGYDPFVYWNPSSVVNPMLVTTNRVATSRLYALEWKMSNEALFSLPAGPVGFAWGVQANRESMNDTPDSRIQAGNITNYGPTAASASRSSTSVYGEFQVPIVKNLDMQAALRADHYSDFGNSVNPKLAAAWHPLDSILLRASATTSFKAPTLPELSSSTAGYVQVADWARCRPLGYTGASCAYYPRDYTVGNPDLKAEKAKNYSFGIVFQPFKSLSASLDWYGIKQTNTIQALDPQYILDNEDTIPGFAALVGRDPRNPALEALHPGLNKGRINSIHPPYMNIGTTSLQGLDLDVKYRLDFGSYGKLTLREINSFALQFDQSIAPGQPEQGRLDSVYRPRWNNSFRIGYEYQGTELALTARTAASTLNIDDPTHPQDPAVTNARIPSYTNWDLNVSFKPIKDLSVNVGANNVFDRTPVFANSAYVDGYVAGLTDQLGRYVYINARYTFR